MQKKSLIICFFLFFFGALISATTLLFFKKNYKKNWFFLSPLASDKKNDLFLEKYEFENLKKRIPKAAEIKLDKILKENEFCRSYLFFFQSEGKKISGMANVPKTGESFPLIVMLRGYVERSIYESGFGTQPAAEVFCRNGYLTLAPDYLGFAQSDPEPNNIWEARFLRQVNIIDLLAGLENKSELFDEEGKIIKLKKGKIALWAHSNGGMSALSVLILTGKFYPASLWAPVTAYFPYDILYYANEAEDRGKALRKALAEFEKNYDAEKFSFDNYLEMVKSPLQLHQGLADPYIPKSWSDSIVARLEKLGVEVNYYLYADADHNLRNAAGSSWNLAVQRDLQFFQKNLGI